MEESVHEEAPTFICDVTKIKMAHGLLTMESEHYKFNYYICENYMQKWNGNGWDAVEINDVVFYLPKNCPDDFVVYFEQYSLRYEQFKTKWEFWTSRDL